MVWSGHQRTSQCDTAIGGLCLRTQFSGQRLTLIVVTIAVCAVSDWRRKAWLTAMVRKALLKALLPICGFPGGGARGFSWDPLE